MPSLKPHGRKLLAVALIATLVTTFSAPNEAQTQDATVKNLGLEGYCPVCLIKAKKWVRGKSDYQVTYDGKTYYFPSESAKQMFEADPAKYVPALGGDCTVCYAKAGWRGSDGYCQPPMYFPSGCSTLRGIAKPGEIVWSRVYVENNKLKMDLGRAEVVKLPKKETERRWNETTYQWPIMHAVTYGVSRDQLMARHKSNHIQVAYAKTAQDADKGVLVKASMAAALGLDVSLCGTNKVGKRWG